MYVIQSIADEGYYIGICRDLDKRLEKHNKGGVRSTKRRKPFRLIFTEKFRNYLEARIREKEIKSYKGGNKFKELIS